MYEYQVTLKIKTKTDVSPIDITKNIIDTDEMRNKISEAIVSILTSNCEKLELIEIEKREV